VEVLVTPTVFGLLHDGGHTVQEEYRDELA
jgi:hypothetical protein